MLNLAAAMLYVLAAAIGAFAALRTPPEIPGASGVRRFWWLVAIFFVLLCVMRLTGVEDLVREELRMMLHAEGVYRNRRTIQGVVVIGVLAALGMAMLVRVLRQSRAAWRGRTRSMRWARWAVASLVFLVILRLISLHAIDGLLYRGPHLNWLIDLGSTIAAAAAAMIHVRDISRPWPPNRHRQGYRGP